MRMTTRHLGWLAVGGFLLLAIACASPQPAAPSQRAEPTAVPDIAATVAARDLAVPAGGATPTAVPPQVSRATEDFAVAHRDISREWDGLHRDLDQWRQSIIDCDASSVRVALRRFAGEFSGITEAARGLPRGVTVRGMSDQLIQAAEREEEALRLLRDTWQPGQSGATTDSAPASLPGSGAGLDNGNGGSLSSNGGSSNPAPQPGFEGVDVARSDASALQKQAADQLSDLQEKTGADTLTQVDDFVAAFDDMSALWDRFHQDYDSFRADEGLLSSVETVDRLGQLVDQYREVVLAVRGLPTAPATSAVSRLLAGAAQGEDLALRRLRGTFQKSDEETTPETPDEVPGDIPTLEELMGPSEEDSQAGDSPADSGEPAAGEPAGNTGSDANESSKGKVTFVAGDPSLFDAFDAQLVEANGSRRQAREELARVVEEVSQDNRSVVTEFTVGYDRLLRQWKAFHQGYDDWRRTEGGCDRTAAVEKLGQFSLSMGEIATGARGLPRATALRPLGELMVEAAEREDEALRQLRDTWRPFDAQVYQPLDRERNTAGKLRRQVALGIQDILERYGITLPDS